MKTFTDAAGRDWSFAITINTVKRVRTKCDIDLVADDLGETLQRLGSDPVVLCDVIYTLCEDQIEKAGVSPEQFGEGLAGDAIDSATEAFLEALVEFSPKKKRAILRGVLQKVAVQEEKAISAALEYLESDKFNSEMQSALEFGASSGSTPASSE